jgi:hypothetical protein
MLSLDPALKIIRMLLAENLAKFPTNEDCLKELRRYIDEKCTHCNSRRLLREVGRRDARCLKCNRKTWLTAKTFFSSIKKPRPYLMAIILLSHRIRISGAAFGRLMVISTSSAQHILKKVSTVLLELLERYGAPTKSSEFGSCVFRRSTESLPREHPHAEFDEIERRLAAQLNQDQALLDSLSADEKLVYQNFSDQPITQPSLEVRSGLPTNRIMSALTMLELAGLIENQNGAQYVKIKQPVKLPAIKKPHKNIIRYVTRSTRYIKRIHGGVSRKYLQLYLALFWCVLDKRWSTEALLKACARYGKLSEREIASYVSPHMVQVSKFA